MLLLLPATRPTLLQFRSLKIRRSAKLMQHKNVVQRILKLLSYKRVGRGLSIDFGALKSPKLLQFWSLELYVLQKCHLTDYEALKSWNIR